MKIEYVEKIYDLALESYEKDEIPVGAIVVKNNEIPIRIQHIILLGVNGSPNVIP